MTFSHLSGCVLAVVTAVALTGCALTPPDSDDDAVHLAVRPELVPSASAGPAPVAPTGSAASSAPASVGPAATATVVLPSAEPIAPWPAPVVTPPSAKPSAKPSARPTQIPSPSKKVDCKKLKCVALTFDDGPVPGTKQLLDLLKKEGVPATFFVVGEMAKAHPEILARMAKDGHVVGNHSWNHPQFTKLTADQIRSQIERTNKLIKQSTKVQPTLLRPPFGASNATVHGIERELGMAQVLWSVDPLDWKDRDAKAIADRVVKAVKPGSIVLSHDLYESTREAYKTIIPALRNKGYTFVTVPQLFGSMRPGVNYSQR